MTVTAGYRSRAVAARVLASTALLGGVLGCASVPQGSPVAIAATSLSPQPLSASTTRKPAPIVLPPVAGRFDYQLGGAYPPPSGTTVVERDRSSAPVRRTYGICYVNAFQTQPEELHWWKTRHPRVLLAVGRTYIQDADWPGEVLLDVSTPAKRTEAAGVVGAWINGCAAKGYRAVELDNLDSWTRSRRRLTVASNVAFAKLLVARAHAKRLAVAQKNAAEIAPQGRRIGFDFAVAEECQVYGECAAYTSAYGRHVIEVEYTDNPLVAFTQACTARARQISVVLRDRDLVPRGTRGYVYRRC